MCYITLVTALSDWQSIIILSSTPRSRLGTCIDSGASKDYCPDRTKFSNYKPVQRKITMADGCSLSAIGMGDLHIELPNGWGKTKAVEMVFTLISISWLDKAGYSITFNKGLCTVKYPKSQTIATIPHSDGLYKIATTKQTKTKDTANIAAGKMSISQAHRNQPHIVFSNQTCNIPRIHSRHWTGTRL